MCMYFLKAALNFAFSHFRTVMLCTVMFDGLVEIRLVVELNVR